jgi:hypothetical protein
MFELNVIKKALQFLRLFFGTPYQMNLKKRKVYQNLRHNTNTILCLKNLTQNQYGFRENRSTELAIIELVDKITQAIDKGEYTIGIFLDLSKAFDTNNTRF